MLFMIIVIFEEKAKHATNLMHFSKIQNHLGRPFRVH